MEHLSRRVHGLLNKYANIYAQQPVRFKGERKPYKNSWKPIPPKTYRDEYFMIKDVKPWNRPLMKYKEEKEAAQTQPLPDPSPVHVVSRVKTLRDQTKVCKMLCEHFNIHEKKYQDVVIPNTKENNELLMQIKHLVRIKALRLPQGLPEDNDMMYTQLKSDGQLSVIKSIGEFEKPEKRTRLLCSNTVASTNMHRVNQRQILQEYYKTKYEWKYNEDGKEHPYKPMKGN